MPGQGFLFCFPCIIGILLIISTQKTKETQNKMFFRGTVSTPQTYLNSDKSKPLQILPREEFISPPGEVATKKIK